MKSSNRLPDLSRRAFARTNEQTIAQRIHILRELAPDVHSIAEICCGDCLRQHNAYKHELGVQIFRGLDLEPVIAESNRANGIECYVGDALDEKTMRKFAQDDVIFFGPPLSDDCDGHRLIGFDAVVPSFVAFASLLLGVLHYDGLLVCICPNSTDMGNISKLYQDIQTYRPDVHLRLIHHSYSTITGNDESTEMRLKYIELWFSSKLEDLWEVRESRGAV
jgi:hypothetical protein